MTDQPFRMAPSALRGEGSDRPLPAADRKHVHPCWLMARNFPEIIQNYSARDTVLYGRSVGRGSAPLDEDQLSFLQHDVAHLRHKLHDNALRTEGWSRTQAGLPTIFGHDNDPVLSPGLRRRNSL